MDVRVKRGEMTGEIDKGRTVICTRSITGREPVLCMREREREREDIRCGGGEKRGIGEREREKIRR